MTIPAPLRSELGLSAGSHVVAYVEDGRLVLEDRDHLLNRIQDEVARAVRGSAGTDSMVDELIADRRAEFAREQAADGPA